MKLIRTRLIASAAISLALVASLGAAPLQAGAAGEGSDAFSNFVTPSISPAGTTINLFNYDTTNNNGTDNDKGINAGHQLHFHTGNATSGPASWTTMNTWTGERGGPRQGIVQDTLVDGYPEIKAQTDPGADGHGTHQIRQESLGYLFNQYDQGTPGANRVEGKTTYLDVQNLLQLDDDGYYYYNAAYNGKSWDDGPSQGYASANYASFDPDTNAFTLYDKGAVKPVGTTSSYGQFFPFNDASEVFEQRNGKLVQKDITSASTQLDHYFGASMISRFVQPQDGRVASTGKPMTYQFSGDDDVWVYIDGVLVGDLGGIHDRCTFTIDFSTGKVVVYDSRGNVVQNTTLKSLYESAGRVDSTSWNGDTFADNTYHTLNFFYLERGGNDSNMSLRFNLVTTPVSSIIKTDQSGNPVQGAEYQLFAADADYDKIGNTPIYTGTTDQNGHLDFIDSEGFPISLSKIDEEYDYLILHEKTTPAGYRSGPDIHFRFEDGLLLATNVWETGSYSQTGLRIEYPQNGLEDAAGTTYPDDGEGTNFAVVLKRDGENGTVDTAQPVGGSVLGGWFVYEATMENVIKAAQSNPCVYEPSSSGAYYAEIADTPGDITKYRYIGGVVNEDWEYVVATYHTSASSLAGATPENTVRLEEDERNLMNRVFFATLYTSNVKNKLLVEKMDDKGALLDGATFGLYKAEDVNVGTDGRATVKEGAEPVDTATTATVTDDLGEVVTGVGLATFPTEGKLLYDGKYYLIETEAPEHYRANATAVPVLVDNTGVYADAGRMNDGVVVYRGVGRVVSPVAQFAVDDDVGAALHDIKADIQTTQDDLFAKTPDSAQWSTPTEEMTQDTPTEIHLHYADDPSDNAIVDYVPQEPGGKIGLRTDEGWSKIGIYQCLEHNHSELTDYKQDIGDVNLVHSYSGSVAVGITDQRTGTLSVEKKIAVPEGSSLTPDAEREFEYTLTLNYADGKPYACRELACALSNKTPQQGTASENKSLTTNAQGMCTFKLKAGQTLEIDDIDADCTYTLTEKGVAPYTPSWEKTTAEVGKDAVQETGAAAKGADAAVGGTIVHGDSSVVYSNAYEVSPVTAEISVAKTLDGRAGLADESYSFTATTADEQTANALKVGKVAFEDGDSTASVSMTDAAENVSVTGTFKTLTFTDAGTFAFKVAEDVPGNAVNDAVDDGKTSYEDASAEERAKLGWRLDGVTYDTHVSKVTFEVTDDKNGALQVIEAVYDNASASTDADRNTKDAAAYTNVYETDDVELGATGAGVSIVKKMTGRPIGAGDFAFTVTPTTSAAEAVLGEEGSTLETTGASLVGNVATETIPGIFVHTFTSEDIGKEYAFTVQEIAGDDDNVSYDESVCQVELKVRNAGKGVLAVDVLVDGEKKATYHSDGSGSADSVELVFENSYDTDTVTVGGAGADVVINAKKVLENAQLEGGDFTFELRNAKDPEGAEPLLTTQNDSDGTITFGKISYDIEKLNEDAQDNLASRDVVDGKTVYSYQYVVSEKTDDLPACVTAETKPFEVNVKITDNGDGTLSAEADCEGKTFEFVNSYGKDGVAELPITGLKVLDDGGFANAPSVEDIEGKFSFELSAVDGAPMTGLQTSATNDGQGSIDFGSVSYTMGDVDGAKQLVENADGSRTATFTYEVVERGSFPGVENDGAASKGKTFDVVVIDDGNGALSARLANGDLAFSFTNVYKVKPLPSSPTDASFAVSKTLEGKALDDGEFTFQLTDGDGKVVSTGTNNVDGVVTMKPVTFDTAGIFSYTLSEVDKHAGGITYDKTLYRVTAQVDDSGDGTLTASWSLTDTEGNPVENAEFANSYEAKPAHAVIRAHKTLEGADLHDGQFTFELTAVDGAPLPDNTGASNGEDGQIAFEAISFDKPGTYVYKMHEVDDGQAGIAYDTSVHEVTVTVSDAGTGALAAEVSYQGGEKPEFVNADTKSGAVVDNSGDAFGDGGAATSTGDAAGIGVPIALAAVLATVAAFIHRLRRRAE